MTSKEQSFVLIDKDGIAIFSARREEATGSPVAAVVIW